MIQLAHLFPWLNTTTSLNSIFIVLDGCFFSHPLCPEHFVLVQEATDVREIVRMIREPNVLLCDRFGESYGNPHGRDRIWSSILWREVIHPQLGTRIVRHMLQHWRLVWDQYQICGPLPAVLNSVSPSRSRSYETQRFRMFYKTGKSNTKVMSPFLGMTWPDKWWKQMVTHNWPKHVVPKLNWKSGSKSNGDSIVAVSMTEIYQYAWTNIFLPLVPRALWKNQQDEFKRLLWCYISYNRHEEFTIATDGGAFHHFLLEQVLRPWLVSQFYITESTNCRFRIFYFPTVSHHHQLLMSPPEWMKLTRVSGSVAAKVKMRVIPKMSSSSNEITGCRAVVCNCPDDFSIRCIKFILKERYCLAGQPYQQLMRCINENSVLCKVDILRAYDLIDRRELLDMLAQDLLQTFTIRFYKWSNNVNKLRMCLDPKPFPVPADANNVYVIDMCESVTYTPQRLLTCLRQHLLFDVIHVRMPDKSVYRRDMTLGLLQGCKLSSALCTFYYREKLVWSHVPQPISFCQFVDDFLLFFETHEDAHDFVSRHSHLLNSEKTCISDRSIIWCGYVVFYNSEICRYIVEPFIDMDSAADSMTVNTKRDTLRSAMRKYSRARPVQFRKHPVVQQWLNLKKNCWIMKKN